MVSLVWCAGGGEGGCEANAGRFMEEESPPFPKRRRKGRIDTTTLWLSEGLESTDKLGVPVDSRSPELVGERGNAADMQM
jgi:hypothetical protein